MNQPTQTALIVEISAPPAVAQLRERFTSDARQGVPAHVTVLFPFAHGAELNDAVMDRVTAISAALESCDVQFSRVRSFSDGTVWLAPDDPQGLSMLIQQFVEGFPEYPPYGGAHAEIVPHLTLADAAAGVSESDVNVLVEGCLPFLVEVGKVSLLARRGVAPWQILRSFALNG